ncbi:MAG: nickel-dependent lactate racemase [Thermoguttaceae bacterium]|nr:nickel-dependent lactate racemase [Thermoguttaceae bacterium]
MSEFPKVFRIRQHFAAPRLEDVAGEVVRQLTKLRLWERVQPGQTVAITAGSRGIANHRQILQAIVQYFRQLGAEPFLVPAMGSHGGGSAEGQLAVLASYGITPETIGCPIRSSMETVIVCQTPLGFPVHFDRHAFQADHVLVVNRIKPHTRFVGPIESGLMKMLLIGLGKAEGAKIYHAAIEDYSFDEIIQAVAHELLARCRILAGLAIVENAYDQTALIEAVPPKKFAEREKQLLVLARQWMARLPFDDVDLLLVDEIGKEISGTGMDTNVIGRKFDDHKAVPGERPRIKRIAVRRLSEATHGNAVGLGIAEFCRSQILQQMDVAATRLNALTANHITAAMLPLDYPTDRQMIEVALQTIGLRPAAQARLLWIQNTLQLTELECGAAYWTEAQNRSDLEILTSPRPLPWDADGNLPSFEAMASF